MNHGPVIILFRGRPVRFYRAAGNNVCELCTPDAAPKWALKEVDAETLTKMCDAFRSEIFRKAEKPDPANVKLTDAGPGAP